MSIRYLLTIYHNEESSFMPYEPGQRLTAKVSHWIDFDDDIEADDIPEWAFETFNADLPMLEGTRHEGYGETQFLAACVYRLLGYRSLSIGDVIEIFSTGEPRWVACDGDGWTEIEPPSNCNFPPATSDTIHDHLAAQRHPSSSGG